MTLEEFKNQFKKKKIVDKFWYQILCFVAIIFSVFMIYSLVTKTNINFSGNRSFHFIGFTLIILLSVYGLIILNKNYKLSFWHNELTKEKNIEIINLACSELLKSEIKVDDNYLNFAYRKSWWTMSYEVHLFADNNLIAINVQGIDSYNGGFIDFGASKRTENNILSIIESKASH